MNKRLNKPIWALAAALYLGAPWMTTAAAQPAEELPEILVRALQEAQAGNLEQAVALLEPEAKRSGADPRLPATLGALYVQVNRPQDALDILEPLAQGEDADPAVLYNAGVAALRTNRVERAQELLSRSVQKIPGSPAARMLGLLHQAQGREEAAYLLLKPWALTHPEDTQARIAAAMSAVYLYRPAEAEELLGDIPTDNPEVRLIWGKILLQKGDTWSALAMVQPVLETAPPALEPDLRAIVADAYLALTQPTSAIDVLRDHLRGHARLAWRLGEAHRQNGDLDAAIATLKPFADRLLGAGEAPAQAVPGANSQLLLIYGRILLEAERPEDAVPVLERAAGLAPGSSLAWSGLGQALEAVGRTDEANAANARASELLASRGGLEPTASSEDDSSVDAVARALRQAQIRLAQGQSEEALAEVRKEQKLNPDDIRPYLVEAQMLLSLGRKLPALQVTHLALQAFPDHPDALYYRGVVNMAREELELAEADFRRALEASPQHTAAMGDLAVLLASQGRKDEARALWERVLALRPDDTQAAENLARLGS